MKNVLLYIFIVVGTNAVAVPFITPCLWSDSACILSSAKKAILYFIKGINELDIPPIEPVFIEEAIADTGNLKLKFQNLKIVGMSKAELVKIERDDAKSTMSLIIDSPIKATGTYTVGGKLLVIDIEGHGDAELKSDKVRFLVEVKMKKIDKDGKTYYTFDGYDLKYDVIDELFFKFDNLFNGDKAKAEPVLDFIRNNWRNLITEIGGPTINKIADIEIGFIQKFFESVPIDELELPV